MGAWCLWDGAEPWQKKEGKQHQWWQVSVMTHLTWLPSSNSAPQQIRQALGEHSIFHCLPCAAAGCEWLADCCRWWSRTSYSVIACITEQCTPRLTDFVWIAGLLRLATTPHLPLGSTSREVRIAWPLWTIPSRSGGEAFASLAPGNKRARTTSALLYPHFILLTVSCLLGLDNVLCSSITLYMFFFLDLEQQQFSVSHNV